ncbi:hypothetical protein [Gynuella sunshinyii]|uniref:Uncharacterized protein n=1 Tax=Gynuella sunshinyii YC6258 TaxID=1445510 RepID=A0A0C5VGR4_9GAMM|nr:hypothetical protein [Gynuella sunshinyii]AJQ93406.1 hypothetical Protein YC6258_01358 [Gynuella sunshinyii YC6258]
MSIYWQDLADDDGLGLQVQVQTGPSVKPGTHLQSGGNSRIRLVTGDRIRFWATPVRDYGGVWVIKPFADGSVSEMPIPPIRSQDIEARRQLSGHDRIRSWIRFFVEQLSHSQGGFLYQGQWLFTYQSGQRSHSNWVSRSEPQSGQRGRLAGLLVSNLQPASSTEAVCWLDWWFSGSGDLVNLKPPETDSGRLKWWRKKVRAGESPPILVWYLNCLDAFVLVDGHCRLQACVLENVPPDLIVARSVLETPIKPDPLTQSRIVASLSRQKDRPGRKPMSVDALNGVLMSAFDDRPLIQTVSRSWATLTESCWVSEVSDFLTVSGHMDVLTRVINRED